MKVLHVAASLSHEWGGPIPVVKGLTEILARKGVEVVIFAPVKRGALDGIVRPKGTETRLFKQDLLSNIWTAHSFELARPLEREVKDFDLVHIHEIWHHPHFAAYRAARKGKKPYVITVHGALEPWCLNFKAFKKKIYAALIQRRILNGAAAIHAITQDEVEHIRAFGVHSPVVMIPNGIDPEEFRELPPRGELERLYPELEGKKVVLFLGRIHPQKGLDILARAFGQIARDREDVRLVIVGPDNEGYQIQVEQMLKTNGVRDKTIFTGLLSGQEKLAALSRADMCTISSYSEVRSIVALEAMICSVPIIITRQCQFPEVAEAKAGIVVEPDADQLVEALTKLIDNPQLRNEMGANGRKLVMERFTWDRVAEQMIQLYQDILDGKIKTNRKEGPR